MGPLGATYNSKAHAPRSGALLQAAGPRQTRTLLWRPPVARCESASTDGSWRALPPPVRRPSSLRAVLWPPSCERWLAAPPALGLGLGLGLAKPKPKPKSKPKTKPNPNQRRLRGATRRRRRRGAGC